MGVIWDINGINRRENGDNKIIRGRIGDCIKLAELIIFIKKKTNCFFVFLIFLFSFFYQTFSRLHTTPIIDVITV
jgi:hypothetical protein